MIGLVCHKFQKQLSRCQKLITKLTKQRRIPQFLKIYADAPSSQAFIIFWK
jgi:hypothetical protein